MKGVLLPRPSGPFYPAAQFPNRLRGHRLMDALAIQKARQLRAESERMGGITQTYFEQFFVGMNFSAVANTTSETSLFSGNQQPIIPPTLFDQNGRGFGKSVMVKARGVISTTSTPTIIFQARLGTTAGASYLSGTSVGVSGTITTGSGISNQYWELTLYLICQSPGIGSGNCTLLCSGSVSSPLGFTGTSLAPTTPPTGTWTATIDDSVTQYLNLSVTWGTASSSNTISMKSCQAYCEN